MNIPVVPWIVRILAPSALVWKLPDPSKSIYITFDDGPIPEVTPQVLEILRNHNAKATFFCVGDNVRKYPEVYSQILKEGHATGNHTFSHQKGNKTNDEHYFNDIDKCGELVKSPLFRPPHGRIKLSQIKYLKHKYKLIMWSILTGDYNHKLSKEQVLNNSIRHTKDGSIIVFHDSLKASERMLYALPRMLEHFTAKGYKFEKIPF
jgi:peptidoglycan-N-acetylglucosamine deacetylase